MFQETACVLCNAMETLSPGCTCGAIMQDNGPVTDFAGPYSPYFHIGFASSHCPHLFTCPACGKDRVITVPLLRI